MSRRAPIQPRRSKLKINLSNNIILEALLFSPITATQLTRSASSGNRSWSRKDTILEARVEDGFGELGASVGSANSSSGSGREESEEVAVMKKADKLAIFLHPWSRLGGCMYDPVLDSLVPTFTERGFCVLLYNSRGVGKSTGRASFTGTSEVEDLDLVVKWGLRNIGQAETLLILGYSFGSLITSMHVPPTTHRIPRIGYILLSYPLSVSGWLTLFRSGTFTTALENLIKTPRRSSTQNALASTASSSSPTTSTSASPAGPATETTSSGHQNPDVDTSAETKLNVLCIFGDEDQFTGNDKYVAWTRRLRDVARNVDRELDHQDLPAGGGAEQNSPQHQHSNSLSALSNRYGYSVPLRRVECVRVEGGDHFWRDWEASRRMIESIAVWLDLQSE